MEPSRELLKNVNEPSVEGKSNEQRLREIKWKVSKVIEKMSEAAKFTETWFNLTNYEAFVNQATNFNEQLKGEGVIPISEEYSDILKCEVTIPKKIKDLGSYTFSCHVGSEYFEKAMCDLGFWNNIKPMSIAIACGIYWDIKSTRISIQLADKSVVKWKGIIEDILVRVDKFIIRVDFIIMDMEKH